jgi:hypothetical protein
MTKGSPGMLRDEKWTERWLGVLSGHVKSVFDKNGEL